MARSEKSEESNGPSSVGNARPKEMENIKQAASKYIVNGYPCAKVESKRNVELAGFMLYVFRVRLANAN